jgi:hypothetical protein
MLRLAAREGHTHSVDRLAQILEKGNDIVAPNIEEAMRYYHNSGSPFAASRLQYLRARDVTARRERSDSIGTGENNNINNKRNVVRNLDRENDVANNSVAVQYVSPVLIGVGAVVFAAVAFVWMKSRK